MPSPSERESPVEFTTLVGAKGLELSIPCLRRFVASAPGPIVLRVHEDGTLNRQHRSALARALPISRLVERAEADEVSADRLSDHPACFALRQSNVLALKLFDVLWFEPEANLRYVDSDVLFVRKFVGAPFETAPEQAVFFPDVQSAVSLRPFQLWRAHVPPIPARLNSGLFAFPVCRFDLDAIERFLASWRGRSPTWIEQTCWAIAAGVKNTALLDPRQFQIPRAGAAPNAGAIALHFVSPVRAMLPGFLESELHIGDGPALRAISKPSRQLSPVELAMQAARRFARRLVASRT